MSPSKKVVLGFLTFLPIILLIAYFVFFISLFMAAVQAESHNAGSTDPGNIASNISMMILFIVISIFVSLGLLIYYLVHAVNNKSFDGNQRLIWVLILILASGIGSIIYFFVEIAPRKPKVIDNSNGS